MGKSTFSENFYFRHDLTRSNLIPTPPHRSSSKPLVPTYPKMYNKKSEKIKKPLLESVTSREYYYTKAGTLCYLEDSDDDDDDDDEEEDKSGDEEDDIEEHEADEEEEEDGEAEEVNEDSDTEDKPKPKKASPAKPKTPATKKQKTEVCDLFYLAF